VVGYLPSKYKALSSKHQHYQKKKTQNTQDNTQLDRVTTNEEINCCCGE
jgi:hypothetical protein